jgi:hypothetical protein
MNWDAMCSQSPPDMLDKYGLESDCVLLYLLLLACFTVVFGNDSHEHLSSYFFASGDQQ